MTAVQCWCPAVTADGGPAGLHDIRVGPSLARAAGLRPFHLCVLTCGVSRSAPDVVVGAPARAAAAAAAARVHLRVLVDATLDDADSDAPAVAVHPCFASVAGELGQVAASVEAVRHEGLPRARCVTAAPVAPLVGQGPHGVLARALARQMAGGIVQTGALFAAQFLGTSLLFRVATVGVSGTGDVAVAARAPGGEGAEGAAVVDAHTAFSVTSASVRAAVGPETVGHTAVLSSVQACTPPPGLGQSCAALRAAMFTGVRAALAEAARQQLATSSDDVRTGSPRRQLRQGRFEDHASGSDDDDDDEGGDGLADGLGFDGVGRRVLLAGAAGSGRTTVLRWCTQQVSTAHPSVAVWAFDHAAARFVRAGCGSRTVRPDSVATAGLYIFDDADDALCSATAARALTALDAALARPDAAVVAVYTESADNGGGAEGEPQPASARLASPAAHARAHLARRFPRRVAHTFATHDQRQQVVESMLAGAGAAAQGATTLGGSGPALDAPRVAREAAGLSLRRLREVVGGRLLLSLHTATTVRGGRGRDEGPSRPSAAALQVLQQRLLADARTFGNLASGGASVLESGEDLDEGGAGAGPEAGAAAATAADHQQTHPPFTDVGGYEAVKAALLRLVVGQFADPKSAARLGVQPTSGVLLSGPSGCGKTLFARSLGAELARFGVRFLAIKPTEVFSKYLGDSEKTLRAIFRRAREESPSVLFIDEIDALVVARNLAGGGSGGGFSGLNERVLTTLLSEMDGVDAKQQVVFLAATNNVAALDKALLRPGRIDSILAVDAPQLADCRAILDLHSARLPLLPAPGSADPAVSTSTVVASGAVAGKDTGTPVDLARVASQCHQAGATGADLRRLCQEAALVALREDVEGATHVAGRHFATAFDNVFGGPAPS